MYYYYEGSYFCSTILDHKLIVIVYLVCTVPF